MGKEKSSKTIYRRKKKEKKKVLEILEKYPIVTIACEKSGISRATFYRWKQEDEWFNEISKKALFDGKMLVNDIAESNIINLLKNGDKTATMYWLNNNHGDYSNRPIQQSIVIQQTSASENKQIQSILENINHNNEKIKKKSD